MSVEIQDVKVVSVDSVMGSATATFRVTATRSEDGTDRATVVGVRPIINGTERPNGGVLTLRPSKSESIEVSAGLASTGWDPGAPAKIQLTKNRAPNTALASEDVSGQLARVYQEAGEPGELLSWRRFEPDEDDDTESTPGTPSPRSTNRGRWDAEESRRVLKGNGPNRRDPDDTASEASTDSGSTDGPPPMHRGKPRSEFGLVATRHSDPAAFRRWRAGEIDDAELNEQAGSYRAGMGNVLHQSAAYAGADWAVPPAPAGSNSSGSGGSGSDGSGPDGSGSGPEDSGSSGALLLAVGALVAARLGGIL